MTTADPVERLTKATVHLRRALRSAWRPCTPGSGSLYKRTHGRLRPFAGGPAPARFGRGAGSSLTGGTP